MSVRAGNALVDQTRKHLTHLKGFVSKLIKLLLNDEKYHQAIHWSETGTAIVITNAETFKKLVLDRSDGIGFRTRNFGSFVRQLNLYGFRKIKVPDINGKVDPTRNMNYKHINFKRDKPELLHLVRKCPSEKKKKTAFNFPSAKHTGIYSRKCSTFSEAGRSAKMKNYGKGTDESFKSESPDSASANKDGSEFINNHSQNSPFEVASSGNKALEDYTRRTFQEEQRVAVQLLLHFQCSTAT